MCKKIFCRKEAIQDGYCYKHAKNKEEVLKTRSIVLIGRTGNGKSTAGNVLINKDGNFREVFKESERGVAETKDVEIGEVLEDGIKYRIVDTVGIGDTQLSEQQVLNKIADAVYAVRDGLSQVLFVTSGRFTDQEIATFNLLRSIIFDKDIVKFTTIVRTKFPGFRKPERCEEDKEAMIRENSGISEVIRSCKKIIHVNNLTKDEEATQQSRKDSRVKLLTYLRTCQDYYTPGNLNDLNKRIGNHVLEKERWQKQLDEIKDLTEKEREEARREIDRLKATIAEDFKKYMQDIQRINQQRYQGQQGYAGYFQRLGALVGEGADNTLNTTIEVGKEICKIS